MIEAILKRGIRAGVFATDTQLQIVCTGAKAGSYYYVQRPGGVDRVCLGQGAKAAENTIGAIVQVGSRLV